MTSEGAERFGLTVGQSSIWIAQALNRADPSFNMGECVEITGELNIEAFEEAVRAAVGAADSLTLGFVETDDGPRQFFAPEREWKLEILDFAARPEPFASASAWMRADIATPIDLAGARPFRFALLHLSPQKHWFYAINHHLVNDGFGWRLVLKTIAELYGRLLSGVDARPQPFRSVQDILVNETAYRSSPQFARDRGYWMSILQKRPHLLLGPAVSGPSEAVEQASGFISRSVDLVALGRRFGASASALFVAAVIAYLFRQTNATDIIVGLQVSARLGEGMREAVGFVTNVVPVRVSLEPTWSFARLVDVVAAKVRESMRHQQYRIEDLVRDLAIPPGGPDLFNVVVNFIPFDQVISFNECPARRIPLGNWRVPDLHVAYYDGDESDGRRVDIIGNAARYDASLVRLHADRLCRLIEACAASPESLCGEIPRMPASERERVLHGFNDTHADNDFDHLVHRRIERRAREAPDRLALKHKLIDISYGQLNGQANTLARHLRKNGVGPDVLVALCMERSIEMVLAIIAILKAGGAYVPVAHDQPTERIAMILRDTGTQLVLTTPIARSRIPESPAKVIVIDHADESRANADDGDIDSSDIGLMPSHLAYVIYTSGSTGVPKGVMIEHRALSNRLVWMQKTYQLGRDDRVLQKTPYTFDVSVWEFLWPLSTGATLVVAGPDEHLDPDRLARTVADSRVTTIHFVPSMLAAFLKEPSSAKCESLTRIICSGEELSAKLAEDCMNILPNATLYNLYGPTEAAIDVTHWTCAPDKRLSRVPIGRPIDNMRIYILDETREPVAIGAIGEIYISGVGLARGYLNRPELTAELFVRDPFADPAARMYRTGDLGLWRTDGAVEYHGRNDNQVKIRGVRIELGEIEAQLKCLPGVRDAAAVFDGSAFGEPRLVGFFVAELGSDADASSAATLRRQLARWLPEQMMPSALIPLEALPLTANGKLDRRALLALCAVPAPEVAGETHAPLTPTEIALAEIWRDLLGRSDFGRDDDFFNLGGHSLLVTRVRSRIRSRFGVDSPLKLLFEKRALADLAEAVDCARRDVNARDERTIAPAPAKVDYVLSFSQQRMWINQSLDPGSTAYNLVGAVKLTGALNVDALSQAFDELRLRHASLRSVYFDTPGGVRQRILPFRSERLEAMDLRARGEQALEEASRLAELDARTPFNLETGPVLRISLFRIRDSEHLLYLALHHISGDQWSFGVLGRDLSAAYNAFSRGRKPELEPLSVQYVDFATWQRSDQRAVRERAQLAYWRQKLEGSPTLDLPTDFPRQQLQTSSGAMVSLPLPAKLLRQLERLSRLEGATLFMTMLAAFAVLLSRLTGQTDISIGAPIANRTMIEIEPLVGTFVNTLVMRLNLSGRLSFREFLAQAREVATEAYSYQDVSFDELVQVVARPRDDGRAPLAQVMFNMLNAPLIAASLDHLVWEQIMVDRGGAQFEISVSVDPQVMNAIVFEYNSDLFKRSSIERLAAQYMQLLESVLADAATPIARLNLLSKSEMHLLLKEWNATLTPPDAEPTFIRMFERRVAERPNAEAIRFEQETFTYAELDRWAEAVARRLRAHGVRPRVAVGVCLPRTPLLLAVLLGVQKAGGHYIPLDPATPRKRLEYIIEDSAVSLLVAEEGVGGALDIDPRVVRLDAHALSLATPETADCVECGVWDLAYIIYTSGSTGRPKGVRVTQRGLANFLTAMRRRPGMSEDDSLVAVTTVSFDISGLELYLPLAVGGRVILASTEIAGDGERLMELISESGATVLQCTPATWRMLLDAGWVGVKGLRAFCGGETLSADLARELLPRVDELWNLYGPTEATIWSTAARIEGEGPISIGTPIDNTRIYIVDDESGLCPTGAVGEIWIGGDGVAEGYQNLPELSATRFQPDPFTDRPVQRVYRTGDLGAWGDDGRLYHLGRKDSQLKVRGFRIEAEEVESLLRDHPGVRDAVVIAAGAGEGDTRLVGYLIAQAARLPTSSEIRAFIRERAPDYMVPTIIVELDKFPLTPNGKIDRKALPDPFGAHTRPTKLEQALATESERALAKIWSSLLKVENIGANDNFFELGGHSLLALRVAALVKARTGRRMDPRTLYFQTLRQIATHLEEAFAGAQGS